MGIVFRQSIKGTIVTFAGAALGAVIVWVSTFVLSQREYGLITNITFLAASAQLVVLMGTANLLLVYSQRYVGTDERRKALLTLSVITTIITSAIFAILFLLLKEPIIDLYKEADQPLIRKYYYFVPGVIILMALNTILEHYLMAHIRIAQVAFAKEIVLRVLNLTLLATMFGGFIAFPQYVTGITLMYMVPLLLMIFAASRTEGFGLTRNLKIFTREEYKDMMRFSWYHLIVGSMLTLLNIIEILMLAPLDSTGMKASAIYNVTVVISAFMFMPYRAMAMSTQPILNRAYIENDMVKVRDLFMRAGINILIVGMAMFVVIGVNLDNAVAILNKGYEPVKYLALILMLGKLADMGTGVNNEFINLSKYYKFNSRISIVLIITVVTLDRIFIPLYGVYGAAWVSTITLVVFNVIKTVFIYKKFGILPFTNKSWTVLVAGIVAGLVGYLWPYLFSPYVDAVVRSIVTLAAYALMLLWLKPSADLSSFLANIRANKRLF